ncbi:uncharacterized protein LOC114518605 [Dendronephthya gigantea]|uniref:uncharacterized protein LOC114518605 n=1 Tax=Dendronephthya gigantea TaxID=151771 RepID=UPI00106C1817|nr:uncharacterized protein LOC114518605 [Dendronephthya gigantea]
MSGKSQNEFIQLLADAVREDIVHEVSIAGMFGVMADTTPDISNKDQLAVAVRYLDTNDQRVERLIQVKEVTDKTGEGMANAPLSSLAECKIDNSTLCFQTYDSASNMSGKCNGAQKKLSEKVEREIIYVPCIAHGANLVSEHSSNSSALIKNMYEVLEAIYVFFNASTKRSKALADLLKEVENSLQLRNLSKTRWTVRPESVEAAWRSFDTVVEAHRALNCSEKANPDTKTKASGLLGRMLRFDFIISLMFAKNVFIKTKMMTKVLERETLDITGAIEALTMTRENIQRIRESDAEIDDLIDASVSFASNFEVVAISEYERYHRTRRLPRRLDERQNTTAEMEMPKFYRKEFALVLDTLLLQIQEKAENIKSALKPLLDGLCPTQLQTYEQIEKLCQIYPNDLPHPALLFAESEMFLPYLHEPAKSNSISESDITYRYAADLALRQSRVGLFPLLAKAYRLLLTAAPTVCKDERSFSKLKFVKSRCRNSMDNKRLDSLMLLACEKDLAEKVDLQNLGKVWSGIKHRRIKLI